MYHYDETHLRQIGYGAFIKCGLLAGSFVAPSMINE
jgi:hypothetical protein